MNPKQVQEKVLSFIMNQEPECTVKLAKGTYSIKRVPSHAKHTEQELYTFEEIQAYYTNYSTRQTIEMYETGNYPSLLIGLYDKTERVSSDIDYEEDDPRNTANIFLEDIEKLL